MLFPPPVEYHGDQVQPPEQTEAVPRETGFQPSNPVAKPSVSSMPSQIEHVPVRRYPNREKASSPTGSLNIELPISRALTLFLRIACCVGFFIV